jgi:hypothetical protein
MTPAAVASSGAAIAVPAGQPRSSMAAEAIMKYCMGAQPMPNHTIGR